MMTTDDSFTKTTSALWRDYAPFMLEELAARGRIAMGPSRSRTAVLPGPVPVVLLARSDDAAWALERVESMIHTGEVA